MRLKRKQRSGIFKDIPEHWEKNGPNDKLINKCTMGALRARPLILILLIVVLALSCNFLERTELLEDVGKYNFQCLTCFLNL